MTIVQPRCIRPSLSFELYPARSTASAEQLERTIAALAATKPDYVSVTCSTDGSNRERANRLISHLVEDTKLKPLAHLTCIGHGAADLERTVWDLIDLGVRGILALRGDKPDDYVPVEDELPFARYLVELVRDVERQAVSRLGAGRLSIGVAAYPLRHPESPSAQHDVEVLVSKQRSGADFAITQVFYDVDDYTSLVERARRAGVTIPIIPGFLPATDLRRLVRLGELTGVRAPDALLHGLETATSPTAAQAVGLGWSAELVERCLDAGAPGVHVYTFNRHADSLALLDRIDLSRWAETNVPVA